MDLRPAFGGVLAAALGIAVSAGAATISVTGTVNEVWHHGGDYGLPDDTFPFQDMAVGDPFTVTIAYEDGVGADFRPDDPNLGSYQEGITSVSITSGNANLTAPGGSHSSVSVYNDQPGDSVRVTTTFATQHGNADVDLLLVGSNAPLTTGALTDGDLGRLPGWDPALSYFRFKYFSIVGEGQFGGTVPVPEPRLAVLLGLAFLAPLRRAQRLVWTFL